jgi:hypothetical protein
MGCGASKECKRNIGINIHKIEVKSVPPVTESEIEEFKSKYLSNAYIHEGEEGFKERMDKAPELMFKRWDWLKNNPEIYVNMLRVKGYSDEQIQDCLDGKRPLSFKTVEIHKELCLDIKKLGKDLEKELGLKDVWFVQTGSAVPGYSSNPCKGLPDAPSKITDPDSSDVDIVIVGFGVKALVQKMEKENKKMKPYPCINKKEGKQSEVRYGNRQLEEISISLSDWAKKWSEKLKGGVQITFQEGNPVFPPWELPIPIHHYDKSE